LWRYTAVLWRYRALLRRYRALCRADTELSGVDISVQVEEFMIRIRNTTWFLNSKVKIKTQSVAHVSRGNIQEILVGSL